MFRRGFRKIHHHSGVWQYKIGNQYVILYSPDNYRHLVSCETMSGRDDWERAGWKGYDQITPQMIVDWIEA
jgi:mRNA-degrading endonuclease RelE of RelBE toxin-antitoxin system